MTAPKYATAKTFSVELCSSSKDGTVKLLINNKPYVFEFESKEYFERNYWFPHTRAIQGTSARTINNKGKFLAAIKKFLVKDPLDFEHSHPTKKVGKDTQLTLF